MGQPLSQFEEDVRRLAESRIDPARVAEDARSSRVAAFACWVGGWLLAAKEDRS